MSRAFVLLTAMPPTTGHLQLLQFSNHLASDGVVAILCTQPFEPFPTERADAVRRAIDRMGMSHRVKLIHYRDEIEQDPNASGFWDMWRNMLFDFGITEDDIIVASEMYGQKLADITGTTFYPYDIDRILNPAKATSIRESLLENFQDIIPEFMPYLRTRITLFGAESTGKTTLSRQLAKRLGGQWLFEYARPYLEHTVNEITPRSMNAIWKGQKALQEQAGALTASPFIIQDTDLYSTIGYWNFPHWKETIGECPEDLLRDASRLKSDMYIVTKSNIPFEQDPLRYGGTKREGSDEYWVGVCEKYHLPYVVLDTHSRAQRLAEAEDISLQCASKKISLISYDRHDL